MKYFFNNNEDERSSMKDYFCKVSLELAIWCWRKRRLNNCGWTDGPGEGQIVITIAHIEKLCSVELESRLQASSEKGSQSLNIGGQNALKFRDRENYVEI